MGRGPTSTGIPQRIILDWDLRLRERGVWKDEHPQGIEDWKAL